MKFSRQEYWIGFPLPPPGDLPIPGSEPTSPALQMDSSPSEPAGKPKPIRILTHTHTNVIVTINSKSVIDT